MKESQGSCKRSRRFGTYPKLSAVQCSLNTLDRLGSLGFLKVHHTR